ncbi:response regulator receiver domain protein [Ichthyophthirius multifiliis]|uniref:Response regulator receiver domain protein n=1 Tax=Ichthyophthirius multifiliis TaxID=5932 RepID=G0QL05_ICHMU|nr:response regulator receiver domain protein [Ichthyophthirius multifiliis]EGR34100.1 response regulator receiver domain protein [Ichthyophthirius multifiliis]|eukprot:XP_004039404.1 response regulator receiver domain protein [Ichthyophthirius multifiliis]
MEWKGKQLGTIAIEETDENIVLIVDDGVFNIFALSNAIKIVYPNVKIVEAQNGQQAIEKVHKYNGQGYKEFYTDYCSYSI